SLSSNPVPEVPCDRAIPPPDIHKIRRQVTQSFSKAPRFSAMNLFYRVRVSKLFDGDARLRERRISIEWQKM
ncbi:hypothetical protein, partial [Burkholderia pseudomallei]|uniref:hypothetical protein n=1 Tax=Burkholderia pseudomallei TaxID=28450 RepID=UPI000F4F44C3